MKTRILIGLWLFNLLGVGLVTTGQDARQGPLSAPTYYLTARVKSCGLDKVEVLGATNLPANSLITVQIADFDMDGWKYFSDETATGVDSKGFFGVVVGPKKGITFHRNLLAFVSFMPFRPVQSPEVLKVIGKRGQLLEAYGDGMNPQVGYVSGDYYVLDTFARLPNCASLPGSSH